jgi:hypothetical protein
MVDVYQILLTMQTLWHFDPSTCCEGDVNAMKPHLIDWLNKKFGLMLNPSDISSVTPLSNQVAFNEYGKGVLSYSVTVDRLTVIIRQEVN